ncbi:MAG: PHP domain-containing protein [Chthonomonadales bacterium]
MLAGRTIDLHTHTTASDGSLSPRELVALASRCGLTAIGITDHDTLDGLPEAEAAARAAGIELVPGVELSVAYPHGRLHLLGYFIEIGSAILNDRLIRLKENRRKRNRQMVERMQRLGLPITLEELLHEAGGGQIGRPHMASLLVRKGAASSIGDAFDRFLADGRPAHVPKDKIHPPEAVQLIHAAGGLAVVAHPDSLGLDEADLLRCLQELKTLGLDGLECYYSRYDARQISRLLQIAGALNLLVTGGSDFHGATKPGILLGHVEGDLPAPAELLHHLKDAAARRRKHADLALP